MHQSTMSDLVDPQTLRLELQAIAAEAIGWLPLGEDGAYLHVANTPADDSVVLIVGCTDVSLAGSHVLLLT